MSLHGIDTSNWTFGRSLLSGHPSTASEVTLAYISSSPKTTAKGTILLIHGFPQTSHQFRRVINPLVAAGYRVIAPDYRGAGESSHPVLGYDKRTMASDLQQLLYDQLGVHGPVHVVGHDIGGMVAHAFATRFPARTASVAWGECPLPGTGFYDECTTAPAMWHFVFHAQLDLPELLVAGKEKPYLKHFFTRLTNNHNAITEADWEHYAGRYAQPGGMRSGFNCYRAFPQDAAENREWVEKNGKSTVPCLSLTGKVGFLSGEKAVGQCKEMYQAVDVEEVEGSGHWVAEENPQGFVDAVTRFVGKH